MNDGGQKATPFVQGLGKILGIVGQLYVMPSADKKFVGQLGELIMGYLEHSEQMTQQQTQQLMQQSMIPGATPDGNAVGSPTQQIMGNGQQQGQQQTPGMAQQPNGVPGVMQMPNMPNPDELRRLLQNGAGQ